MSRKSENRLFISKPLIVYFLLSFVFLTLLFIFFRNSMEDVKTFDISLVLKNTEAFSHLGKVKELSYRIKSRNNLNSSNVHRVSYQVEIPKGVNKELLMAVAQKIVKDTIGRELCHSVTIDFGEYGYVNFAPYGNLFKAGEVPFDNYRNYRFNYVFFPSFSKPQKKDSS